MLTVLAMTSGAGGVASAFDPPCAFGCANIAGILAKCFRIDL